MQLRALRHFILSLTLMDETRTASSVRNLTTLENSTGVEEKPREPRKRFVGRRAAAERVSAKSDLNGTIEETGVVQG